MRKFLVLLVIFPLLFLGCKDRFPGGDAVPVEPLVPEGSSTGLLSYYGNITAGREINDLAPAPGGDKVLVAPRDNKIYLLHQDGRILWEKDLNGEAFKLSAIPDSDAFALVTREGRVIFFDADHQVRGERDLQREIVDFAVSEGSLTAVLTLHPGEEASGEDALLHLLDSRGFPLWERPVTIDPRTPVDLMVSKEGGGIIFISRNQGKPALSWYDLEGNLLWQKDGYTRTGMSLAGDVVAAVAGPLITVFDGGGHRKWGFDNTGVNLDHVQVSQNGKYVVAYSSYSTGQDNLFYFASGGESPPWKVRVPAQSKISLSASGQEVVATTWQHYLEEFTQVSVLDTNGRQVNALQIAGRGKKAALSSDGSTLVLSSDDGSIFFLDVTSSEGLEVPRPALSPAYKKAAEDSSGEYVIIYFYNDRASDLIPVGRKISGEASLERALKEMIKGPRLGSGLCRTIPRDAGVTVKRQENTVYIDLPLALASIGGTDQMEGLVNSMIYTVSHFPAVNWIQFLVEGEKRNIEVGSVDFSRPVPVRRPGLSPGRQIMYAPVLSGNRYYLKVQEVSLLSTGRRDLAEKLLTKLINSSKAFFPQDMSVNTITIDSSTAQVDFSADAEGLRPLLMDPDRSELLIDAVTYTLAENFALDQVEILVNGNTSGQIVPQLLRTIIRPFIINPE